MAALQARTEDTIIQTVQRDHGRVFQEWWLQQFAWLDPGMENSNVFCKIYKWASINKQIPPCRIPKVWVSDGYSNWKALGRDGAFKTHEKYKFHRLANTAYVSSSSSSESVMDLLASSTSKRKKKIARLWT